MAMNLGTNNVNQCKQIAFDLNVEPNDDDNNDSPDGLDLCSICHEPLVNNNENRRTLVTLKCAHKFHLDCIGSTFNANNLMQCPNCMQIEPGQWQYGTRNPIPDSDDDDWIVEEEEDNNIGLIHDLTLGSELCPFEGLGQQNSIEGPDLFDNHCIYVEGSFAIPQSFDIVGAIYLPLISSPLYPNIPLPSNPRIFWSPALAPWVMRGRHYVGHPSCGHGPSSRSDNSIVNAPVATPYQNCSLVANIPSNLSTPISQVNDNGFNRFNVWDHQPLLEQWQQNQMERQFYRILYGEENGSGAENNSGEGRGSDRNGGGVGSNTFARSGNGDGDGI